MANGCQGGDIDFNYQLTTVRHGVGWNGERVVVVEGVVAVTTIAYLLGNEHSCK